MSSVASDRPVTKVHQDPGGSDITTGTWLGGMIKRGRLLFLPLPNRSDSRLCGRWSLSWSTASIWACCPAMHLTLFQAAFAGHLCCLFHCSHSSSHCPGAQEQISSAASSATNPSCAAAHSEIPQQHMFNILLSSLTKIADALSSQPLFVCSASPSNEWTSISVSSAPVNSSVSLSSNDIVQNVTNASPSIPEICFKEVLPCNSSPLGFNLFLSVK